MSDIRANANAVRRERTPAVWEQRTFPCCTADGAGDFAGRKARAGYAAATVRSRAFYRLCVGLALETALLGVMARYGNFLRAGEAGRFVLTGFTAGAAYWVAVRAFEQVPSMGGKNVVVFWAAAVALRLVMLPTAPGDDVWRYRWEGRMQVRGFNPYQLAPDAPTLAGLRDEEWARINHRDYPAIYPPLTEMVFAALAAGRVPLWGYKALFALADLGTAAILRWWLARRGRPETAAWYAWNPLVVYTSAGAAHFDSLMVLAMVGALATLEKAVDASARSGMDRRGGVDGERWRWVVVSGGLLGAAIALKVVPAVLVSLWVFAVGWRRGTVAAATAGSVPLGLATWYGFPGVPVFRALAGFARNFRVNDAGWWVVDPGGKLPWLAAGVSVVVCGGLAVGFRRDWRRGALWVLGAAVLLSPQVHAWYVVWVLPLAAMARERARAWFVFSVSLFGYFLLWEVNHASGKPWIEPGWLRALVYLPPLAAWGWWNARRRRSPSFSDAEGAERW